MQKTPKLLTQIEKAQNAASKNQRPNNVIDLFCTLLTEKKFRSILESFSIQVDAVIGSMSEKLPQVIPQILDSCEEEYSKVLKDAEELADDMDMGYCDTEHVFLALLSEGTTIRSWFAIHDLPIEEICERAADLACLKESPTVEIQEALRESEMEFAAINRFCKNLNFEIAQQRPRVFGRENEVSTILDILCRQNKANVLLIGEPGVGRKSIIHKVISTILEGRSSEILRDKTFLQLNPTAVMAGTAMFGSLEKRFEDLADEFEEYEDAVVVIPDFQVVSSKGLKENAGDFSSFMKTLLGRNVPCIATITQADYKKSIEEDKSLTNFFEIVRVEEPTKDEALKIVEYRLPQVEDYHQIEFPAETVSTIVDLCDKFLPYRQFPEKALDVLDAIGAKIKNAHFTQPPELVQQWQKITQKIHPNLEKGSPEFQKLNKSIEAWAKKLNKWLVKADMEVPVVTVQRAVEIFAQKYKITDNQLKNLDSSSIGELADKLKNEIFGQDEIVDRVVDVLMCSKTGLRDKNKPLGKFLFVGESSTGKTEMGKQLAEYYFGDKKSMIKLDMSEFQEKYSLTSMIGSTAGYVGYESGGRLTEFVKHNPSCVVLFDEVEKAHPDLMNLLLQIMDDGYLTDGQGFRVDFTNTIIILTSNLGSGQNKSSVGFVSTNLSNDNHQKAIKAYFRPELLARLDEILYFNSVTEPIMRSILNKFVGASVEKLKESGIILDVDESVFVNILEIIKGENSHARNIQATVRKMLDIPVSKFILKNRPKKIFAKIENRTLYLQ